ncbi:hypothetical protein KP509_01G081600 [Ceratopteris richardii]|uniref:U4/U6.U5 small nuclear ribonucleoprotein 27kDa protein domain-containing protein n=1 Tax=Ceratopteris richardii TaxID=49495 RepID=A0A8T2VHW9_CERRI|nr:hypothetical protein KP509_01G081600 [Ceratopteris richardii]
MQEGERERERGKVLVCASKVSDRPRLMKTRGKERERDLRRKSRNRTRSRSRERARSRSYLLSQSSRGRSIRHSPIYFETPHKATSKNISEDGYHLADVEELLMKKLGIPVSFDSTKGEIVPDADVSAVKLPSKRQPRQYMNRKCGFIRPLPSERNRYVFLLFCDIRCNI